MDDQTITNGREFNDDREYNRAYSNMFRVPRHICHFLNKAAKQIIPSINSHIIMDSVAKARQNAGNLAEYQHYVNIPVYIYGTI